MKPTVPLRSRRSRRGSLLSASLGAFLAVAFSAVLGGCPGSKGQDGCTLATEGCACTQAGACDPGLSCQKGSCLKPGAATSAGEPGRPTGSLELQPFRAEGFSFAIPRGFVRKEGGGPGTYVFVPGPGTVSEVSRFQLTYVGRMDYNQMVRPWFLLENAIAEQKATLVGKMETAVDYAAATLDTGAPGPERFRRIMYLGHWDLHNEDVYVNTAPRIRRNPAEVDLFTVELAVADAGAVERLNLAYVLRSIGWGLSIPADELSRADVVGTWQSLLGGLPLQYEDAGGNWTGGQNEGSAFKLTLGADGTYDLSSVYSVQCTGSVGCAIEGIVKANSKGRFDLEGGVLVFHRSECQWRLYDKNLQLTSQSACPYDRVPVTLAAGRGENGSVRFSGLGSDVINADDQRMWSGARSPAGAWNVTEASRQATPAPPSAGGLTICGAVDEREPNFLEPDQIDPFTKEVVGCLPSFGDFDYHEITTPQGGPGGGWIELTVVDRMQGFEVEVRRPKGGAVISEVRSPPGVTFFKTWISGPQEKFIVSVDRGGGAEEITSWSRYTMKAKYTEVKDPYEPNETAADAKPLPLGEAVYPYFFDHEIGGDYHLDVDSFVFDLEPGPVSIKVDQIPSDIEAYAYFYDPDGRSVSAEGLRVATARGARHTPILDGRATVVEPGPHRLEIHPASWADKNVAVPESWTKPYRLVVTQP